MENKARGGVSRDKYTSLSAEFFVDMSKGSALSGILYFE